MRFGEVEFKPLIPKLKAITNKKRWSEHLMGKAMREILGEITSLLRAFSRATLPLDFSVLLLFDVSP